MRFCAPLLSLLFVAVFPVAAQTKKVTLPPPVAWRWEATIINSSNLEVPFILDVKPATTGELTADIVNGDEKIPFTSAAWDGAELKLHLAQYDGTLTARLLSDKRRGDELIGEWSRQTSQGMRKYAFHATRQPNRHYSVPMKCGVSIAGDWQFTFESDASNPDRIAPAAFTQKDAHLTRWSNEGVGAYAEGTVAPVSGDFGLMVGRVNCDKKSLKLSRFDGIHLLVLSAEFQADGSLAGKLNTQAFTAVRKDASKAASSEPSTEPDSEAITTMANPDEPFRFSARDPKTGTLITQDDSRFKGKPYIVDIFGTWCPNCHDEAPVLQDIYKRFQSQSLEIVGLAYEYVDDPQRNARLLDIYRKKYQIGFPMLLAGTTDSGQISKTLPQLKGFGAYPTTIFVGADGKVKKIHAGFAGPATGARFTEVKQKFEENVKQLVAK